MKLKGIRFYAILAIQIIFLLILLRRLKASMEKLLRFGDYEESELFLPVPPEKDDSKEPKPRTIYVVTPTYTRPAQLGDLTRLANTLRLVPGVHWIVAEDRNHTTRVVSDLLSASTLRYTHLAASRPTELIGQMIGRGVFNRRISVDWIRTNADDDGVVYFADDDNSYDVRLFEEVRQTVRVSVFPVGLILKFGLSSPVVRKGKVVGFFDAFKKNRKFAVDMAGFAVSVKHLKSKPQATFPAKVSYLEDGFIRDLDVELKDLEPRAEMCTRVYVWHTKTDPRTAYADISNLEDGEDYTDTNIIQLHKNVEYR